MKKPFIIVIVILVLIIALPLVNLIRWKFQPKKPIDIILVDKTVPTLDREKHRSFNWILTNERFVKREGGSSYSYVNDYYGFVPKRPLREKQWDKREYHLSDLIKLAEKNDAIYFLDTYGVFFNDWWSGINKSRKSRKLYGGFNNNDFLLVKEMKDRNKLIIMEYNSFDFPTEQFFSVRVQEKLGVVFSGWTGKYFTSLDTTAKDFPIWMTSLYRKQYLQPWKFKKSGIVILRDKEIIVLENGTHLKNPMLNIITDSTWCRKFGVAKKVAFDKWFDIIDPQENNVISNFRIETNSVGDTLLAANNLSNEFPAVIRDRPSGRVYYFSGDFATGKIPYWTSKFRGVDKLKGILYSEKPDDTRRFFWLYYKPLINGIFTDYYNTSKK